MVKRLPFAQAERLLTCASVSCGQGDKERALGLAISPLMDRNEKGGMTRSQLGFFNIVGAPLFMALIELFDEARPMMQGLQANYHHWESGKIAELVM